MTIGDLVRSDVSVTAKKPDSPAKISDAASQFEGLLIGQMLKSAREAGSGGWSGKADDQSNDAIFEMAEQQLSQVLASNGGMGLAKIIVGGITKQDAGMKQKAAGISTSDDKAIPSP